MKQHRYTLSIEWQGNEGSGTSSYNSYRRDHAVLAAGKKQIACSSDPSFRGDPTLYNPEELLVASLSSCHMLWYLHLCSTHNIVVMAYKDDAVGTMEEASDGSGEFVRVLLRPVVTIAAGGDQAQALSLHGKAHRLCFIARSVRFPVDHEPQIVMLAPAQASG